MKRNIVISSGDPGGVGAQVIIKAINKILKKGFLLDKYNIVLLGDKGYYEYLCGEMGLDKFWERVLEPAEVCGSGELNGVVIVDFKNVDDYRLGETGASYGRASIKYLEYAIHLYKRGLLWVLLTAPICKKSLWDAGYRYAGHTHYLAVKLKRRNVIMSMLSRKLKVFFATDHVSFKAVPMLLTELRIKRTIQSAVECLKLLKVERIRIAVCSLNPHAGEGGIFGNEEEAILSACEHWLNRGVEIVGPISPEVCFKRAVNDDFGAVVVMYHDQGMIPFKLFSKGEGINVTWGLPFIRISPEHGTAFDIAKSFIANESSMLNAFYFAMENF
jgi:4-hydroxythreonine-4-phosphate dehydrogenase